MYKFIINKSEKYYNLVGDCKRDCNIFQVFWFDILDENCSPFDILDENCSPFLEKTANRLSSESMFTVMD